MGDELTVEIIKQLPLAVVAIIACIALWRRNNKLTDDLFTFMQKQLDNEREKNQSDVGELRTRMRVVEDNLHIRSVDRTIYQPTLKLPTTPETKELD